MKSTIDRSLQALTLRVNQETQSHPIALTSACPYLSKRTHTRDVSRPNASPTSLYGRLQRRRPLSQNVRLLRRLHQNLGILPSWCGPPRNRRVPSFQSALAKEYEVAGQVCLCLVGESPSLPLPLSFALFGGCYSVLVCRLTDSLNRMINLGIRRSDPLHLRRIFPLAFSLWTSSQHWDWRLC